MPTQSLGMTLGKTGLALLLTALAVEACGGDSKTKPDVHLTSTGGKGNGTFTGGSGGSAADSGEGGMGATGAMGSAAEGGMGASMSTGGTAGGMGDPNGPVVEITSPAAVDGPNDEGVIVDEEVDVLCEVTKREAGRNVDPATVIIEMHDAEGNIVESYPGTPTDNPNEYTARFVTTKIPDNGRVSFVCLGADVSSPALAGDDEIRSFVDHGPTITVIEPEEASGHALIGAVKIVFQVAPAPIADDDDGAAIDEVTLSVDGKNIAELDEDGGEYTASVDLQDSERFPNPPDGETPILIHATNVRNPAGARDLAYNFVVDGAGPEITITEPDGKAPRGGKVDLVFTVTDALSGVDSSTVVVRLSGEEFRFDADDPAWSKSVPGDDLYTFNFDTTQLTGSKVKATIDISAADKVGNTSDGETVNLNLDNVPPIVDLDPLAVRALIKEPRTCSVAYDPIGPGAASDLDDVLNLKLVRAIAWDDTNWAPGITVRYYSVVNLESVYVYLQPDPSNGLLIDTNDDGICDEIQKEDPVSKKLLPYQHLVGIPPTGAPWFGPIDEETTKYLDQNPMPGDCAYGTAASEPEHLCQPFGSDMVHAMPWDVDHTIPAVFAIGPLEGPACMGTDWEFPTSVEEGWICVAARAEDNTGNVGISQPIRLCYDDGVGAPPACRDDKVGNPPPSCVVDDCQLPVKFEGGLYLP